MTIGYGIDSNGVARPLSVDSGVGSVGGVERHPATLTVGFIAFGVDVNGVVRPIVVGSNGSV